MLLADASRISILAFAATVVSCGAALAQEQQASGPWGVMKLEPERKEAGLPSLTKFIERAEKGEIAAAWKLGRMYAEGGGVQRDDFEAYKYFSMVVHQDVEAGSQDEIYIGDAYLMLGHYAQIGIPGSPVEADPGLAREFFARAATYRNTNGQFEFGRSLVSDPKPNVGKMKTAITWFRLATRNGHEGARAMLGKLYFQGGNLVEGLAQLTVALERAPAADREWIRQLQEEAYAVTDEPTRKAAINRASALVKQGRLAAAPLASGQ